MEYILKKVLYQQFQLLYYSHSNILYGTIISMIMIVIFLTFNEYVSAKEILEICINPFLWVQ